MSADPDVVAAADRNFIGAYEKLAEHQAAGAVQSFGAVTAFVSGLAISFLNGCIALAAAAADLEAAVEWLDERPYPYEVWIGEQFRRPARCSTRGDGLRARGVGDAVDDDPATR